MTAGPLNDQGRAGGDTLGRVNSQSRHPIHATCAGCNDVFAMIKDAREQNRLLWLRILERLHGRSTVREDLFAPSTPGRNPTDRRAG